MAKVQNGVETLWKISTGCTNHYADALKFIFNWRRDLDTAIS